MSFQDGISPLNAFSGVIDAEQMQSLEIQAPEVWVIHPWISGLCLFWDQSRGKLSLFRQKAWLERKGWGAANVASDCRGLRCLDWELISSQDVLELGRKYPPPDIKGMLSHRTNDDWLPCPGICIREYERVRHSRQPAASSVSHSSNGTCNEDSCLVGRFRSEDVFKEWQLGDGWGRCRRQINGLQGEVSVGKHENLG